MTPALAFCRLAPWLERLRLLCDAKAAQGVGPSSGETAAGARAATAVVLSSAALRSAPEAPKRTRLLAASIVCCCACVCWGV